MDSSSKILHYIKLDNFVLYLTNHNVFAASSLFFVMLAKLNLFYGNVIIDISMSLLPKQVKTTKGQHKHETSFL